MIKRVTLVLFLILIFAPKIIFASSLSFVPSSKDLTVGDTFDVSIILNTQGKSINAVQVFLSFPKDLLQVISYSDTSSVIGLWITQLPSSGLSICTPTPIRIP